VGRVTGALQVNKYTKAAVRVRVLKGHYFTTLHCHIHRGKKGTGKEIEDLHIWGMLSNAREQHLWAKEVEMMIGVLDDLAAFHKVEIVNLPDIRIHQDVKELLHASKTPEV
jgi:hypothetical protein